MCDYGSRFRILKGGKISLIVSAFLATTTLVYAAPSGGVVTSGSASISQSGTTTTINQSTQKASINWNTFSMGTSETVNFNQPNVSSITLNRVVGNEKSVIDGTLNANGQVWILNSNGVLFNANAKVNTSGLFATTKSLSDTDFQAGNYSFKGDSTASVINLGSIDISNGGYASLLANSVSNKGTIKAIKGMVTLTGASEATINLNGNSLVFLKVDKGVLDALVENKGAIIADGGTIYLTTNAANELLKGVVNNTGIIEAQTLDDITGKIVLYAHGGTTNVGGTIDASAPNGGNGGFIETSGAEMNVLEGGSISASSKNGTSGTWLIDPYNYTVDSTAANTIVTALKEGTSVTIDTASSASAGVSGSSGSGDIEVSSSIATDSMSADATLTFKAARNIIIDSAVSIDATGSSNTKKLGIVFLADSDYSGDGITLMYGASIKTNGGSITFGDGTTKTLNSVSTLVGGDVYFNALTAQALQTNGGNIIVNGAMMLANTAGLNIDTNGGNVTFAGLVDSGNTYTQVYNNTGISWDDALAAAKSGDGASVNNTYLATITSRLENIVAGQSVGYQESWIGGQRVYDSTTKKSYWRWVTGPEGFENSGAGRIFYTQTNVNSGTSTGYTNWNSGEPNNNADGNGPYALSMLSETALQFTGALGQWNDLANSQTKILNYYVKETNLVASPLTISAGDGTVTFNKAVGSNKALKSLDITANTTAINGGGITTEGAQTYNSNITLGSASTTLTQTNADMDFTFQANKSITNAYGNDASLTIKTTRNILMNQGATIASATGGLDTIFWSDSDANNNGYIFIYDGNSISTNGGDIVLAGGTDTNSDSRPDGFATSNTTDTSGVNIGANSTAATSATTIQSGGGDITIKGKSVASSGTGMGINYSYGGVLNAGNGSLTMVGESSSNHGIELSAWLDSAGASYLDINAHTISISGTSSKAGANGLGSSQLSNEYTRLSAGAGGITLYGNNTADTTRGIEISLNASTTGGGDITLESPNKVNFYNGSNTHSLNAGTGDITLKSNILALGSNNSITSNGTLTLLPYTDSTTIGVAGGSGTLSLITSYFTTNFTNGFEKIVIGSATQTGNIVLGALTLQDPFTLYTKGAVSQTGAISGNQDLALLGIGGAYNLSNTGNNIASLSADTGSITYVDSNTLSLKNISATGVIDIATQSGDLTLTQAITTSDTSNSALTLNAGKSTAAGTSTGGNILVAGGTVLVGVGGRATLYTGSVDNSTGLSALVGSGHFRYNSDESVANYSASLGSGIYAIYREQPTLSVTPSTMSSVYGDTVNLSSETYTLSDQATLNDTQR